MLKTLIKKEFLGFFGRMFASRRSKKNSKGSIVLFIILFLYLFIVLGVSFGTLCYTVLQALIENGNLWFYGAFTAVLASMFALLGSVFTSMTQLYDAKDNDLLLSLPIPPSYILLARMIPLGVFNVIYASLVLLPAIIVYATVMGLSYALLLQIVILLLVSVITLAISCLIGRLLAGLLAKVKRKTLITTIFSIVFLVAYMLLMFNINAVLDSILNNVISLTAVFEKYLPTLYWTGLGFGGNGIWFLVTFVLNAVISVGIFFIISKTYIKTINGSKGTAKKKYKNQIQKAKSPFVSLLYKEWKRFSGSATYFMNCAIGVFMVIIAAVVMLINTENIKTVFKESEILSSIMPVVFLGCLLFLLSTVCVSACSVSLEGKALWILKSLPIKAYDVLLAKITLHLLVSAPVSVVVYALLGIVYSFDFLSVLFGCILIVAFVFVMGSFGLKRNLKNPDLEWTNESQPVKQSINVLICMLLGAVFSTVFMTGGIFLSLIIPPYVAIILFALLFTLFAILYNRWFKKHGAQKLMDL